MSLLSGENRVILALAVSSQYTRVTDDKPTRQTDRQHIMKTAELSDAIGTLRKKDAIAKRILTIRCS